MLSTKKKVMTSILKRLKLVCCHRTKRKKNIGIPTELLEKSATTSLLTDENTTMLLDSESVVQERRASVKKLVMLDEVILVHTDEVIS